MTHQELVSLAAKWATGRHEVVITERSGGYGDIPDVIGLAYQYSTMIECKISRNDFFADKRKMSRQVSDICMGNYRIYCVPKGLLTIDDIPDDWGLLEVYPSGFIRLETNLYMARAGAIWWHNDTVDKLRQEKHLLMNHFIYPRKTEVFTDKDL